MHLRPSRPSRSFKEKNAHGARFIGTANRSDQGEQGHTFVSLCTHTKVRKSTSSP